MVIIKPHMAGDIERLTAIYAQSFSGMQREIDMYDWFTCNIRAYPRMQHFVASQEEEIYGYILWTEHGGFRKQATFELEQIAVDSNLRNQGIGTKLIERSLDMIMECLEQRCSVLENVLVTTGVENHAKVIYLKTIGRRSAHVQEKVIENLYRGDEVVLIFRGPFTKR